MLIVYEEAFDYCEDIYKYLLLDNILYIVTLIHEQGNYTYMLIKIDIKKRIKICSIYLGLSSDDFECLCIVNGRLYVHKNNSNDVYIYDFKNKNEYVVPHRRIVERLYAVLDINNEAYYMVRRGGNPDVYDIRNVYNNEFYGTVEFECRNSSINGQYICTTNPEFEGFIGGGLIYFDNYMVFIDKKENKYTKFDLNNNTLVENKISDRFDRIFYFDMLLADTSNKKVIFYKGSRDETDINIYAYNFEKEKNYKLDEYIRVHDNEFINRKICFFEYKDNEFYMTFDAGKLIIYKDIGRHGIPTNIYIKPDVKTVIGTKNNNIEIETDLLLYRSKVVDDIKESLNYNNSVISDKLENIRVYYNFITGVEVTSQNYYTLFTICNYLLDIDVNYVAELIVEYVGTVPWVKLDESYRYLQLLATSVCHEQFTALTYTILKKFEKDEIFKKLIADDTELGNHLRQNFLYGYLEKY